MGVGRVYRSENNASIYILHCLEFIMPLLLWRINIPKSNKQLIRIFLISDELISYVK